MTFARGRAAALLITACSVLASGCAATQPGHKAPPPRQAAVLTSSQLSMLRADGAGDTAFGLRLLSALCGAQPGSNVVISPVSLETGLGMAYLGARGATATVMAGVLHLPAMSRALAARLRARSALLASLDRPGVTFATSNRIWADPSLVTNAGYVAALRAGYQAGLTHLPLLSQPERARRTIDSAVASDTRGHIKDLIPAGTIPPQTIGWVLTDALYLNAAWKHPFERAVTQAAPFATAAGQVTAHYLNGGGFATATRAGWTAVSLPYKGSRLAMLALLPPPGEAVAARAGPCQLPAAAQLGALAAGLAATGARTAIALPKVSLTWQASLKQALTSLGMGAAFGASGNFTGISPQAGSIGFVEHAATLAVGEKGTVASAATAIGIVATSGRVLQPTLTFNRPYLLVLRDSLTGEPLMLAWVANPARG